MFLLLSENTVQPFFDKLPHFLTYFQKKFGKFRMKMIGLRSKISRVVVSVLVISLLLEVSVSIYELIYIKSRIGDSDTLDRSLSYSSDKVLNNIIKTVLEYGLVIIITLFYRRLHSFISNDLVLAVFLFVVLHVSNLLIVGVYDNFFIEKKYGFSESGVWLFLVCFITKVFLDLALFGVVIAVSLCYQTDTKVHGCNSGLENVISEVSEEDIFPVKELMNSVELEYATSYKTMPFLDNDTMVSFFFPFIMFILLTSLLFIRNIIDCELLCDRNILSSLREYIDSSSSVQKFNYILEMSDEIFNFSSKSNKHIEIYSYGIFKKEGFISSTVFSEFPSEITDMYIDLMYSLMSSSYNLVELSINILKIFTFCLLLLFFTHYKYHEMLKCKESSVISLLFIAYVVYLPLGKIENILLNPVLRRVNMGYECNSFSRFPNITEVIKGIDEYNLQLHNPSMLYRNLYTSKVYGEMRSEYQNYCNT